jgi:NAD(P)-dependent dehydrogenase (short-subunit alcohol dehydrogenase family)
MQLRNTVILVTGGAVRIGRAICTELLKTGALIYCHYHQSEAAARDLQEKNPRIRLLPADLTKSGVEKQLIGRILAEEGRIDILVNSAAIFIKTPFGHVGESVWYKMFDLNIKAGFFLAQEAGIKMQIRGSGKIINIADTSGLKSWPSYIPYSMTKSAVINMTKGLAKALAPSVQVNCINPGPVLLPENYSPEQRKKAIERTLLKREGRAEDIAFAVRFLLEDGDYITGASLNVDGGRSIL